MRRNDRAVTESTQIKTILDACRTCHLAMVDRGSELPYVIPLSYAYSLTDETLTLFFHSAYEGRKIEILRNNDKVCFAISSEGEAFFSEELPCNSGYHYSSVHGFGRVQFVEDITEKCLALALIMKHQANYCVEITPAQAKSVCIFKVTSTSFTGKMNTH